MAEEEDVVVEVQLAKRRDNAGFGFSLLGNPSLPPIIQNILEDTPAAESGEVEIGDVILKINETDVSRFSTKEVLKCLRLSGDPVTLKIKRDPKVRKHLQSLSGTQEDGKSLNGGGLAALSAILGQKNTTNGSFRDEESSKPLLDQNKQNLQNSNQQQHYRLDYMIEENERLQWQPLGEKTPASAAPPPKFEAFMMTGEHILNISRMPQNSAIVPKQQKKVDNLRYHNSHAHHLRHQQNKSVPNSPNEMDLGHHHHNHHQKASSSPPQSFVRNSRSEDQLQANSNDAEEDMTSSLNTLLDTRPDLGATSSDSERIVWTYNAPVSSAATPTLNGSSTSPSSSSGSPASPTSVSSSVMSSQSGSRRLYSFSNGPSVATQGVATDFSVSEAVSNISSPDYHDDDSVGIRDCVMEISDHSDSDSTLLVSEPKQRKISLGGAKEDDHRLVIQVPGPKNYDLYCNQFQHDSSLAQQDEDVAATKTASSSPLSSEDESDVDSLHSFHYSPKAVDMPSAIRLAKRLYGLDGFKKSDVSRHLSKNNDFSRAVAEEYLKYFNFEHDTLDLALRKFLKQFSLTGETQERERVLVHFSKRYLDCNPGSFNSQDAVHTLTCAIMLLNTDLHGQNITRKMTCGEFIENLSGLNESENFPKEVLKQLYHAIKTYPLEWAIDEEVDEGKMPLKSNDVLSLGGNPFLDVPISTNAIEYKKGYVMRKCCYESNAKRTPFHKRSWKMFYCTLRDLVLYLHKDEHGFRKNQMGDNLHNAIRIHHALATKAQDYTKKQYVFRLQTADQAEYLFQTSDSKELQSWIDTINVVCASFSAPPLEAAVGSQKKFQRPLLPCSLTKLSLREQLVDHEERVMRLEASLEDHRRAHPDKGSKSLIVQNYKEKEAYLTYELSRYRTYAFMLRSKLSQFPELGISLAESIGEVDEAAMGMVTLLDSGVVVPPPIPERPSPPAVNREDQE